MNTSLRVLIVEDSPCDAELATRMLHRDDRDLYCQVVETPEAMLEALDKKDWDLVISDYSMPRFNGLTALKMVRDSGLDLPFILVSGTVGEEVAVEAMKCGANDYILKNKMARLPFAVERELRNADMRREARRAEEEVARARDLALETVRLRLEFVHNVNHELRTPLHQMLGMAGLLMLDEDLNPEQREEIGVIASSGELLLAIVNDILDFSKLSAGKVVLEKLDFNLVDLMEGVIDSFAEAVRAKKVALAMSMDAALPATLQGDPDRLRQILNKLIENAIKFSSAGDVLVRVTKAEEAADEVLVRFEVIDTGIGIPLELQARLFQPFVQADGSNTRRYGGTGLGLVISAQLVEQMRGEIGFDSEPGKGSNFHFTARLAKGEKITLPAMTA